MANSGGQYIRDKDTGERRKVAGPGLTITEQKQDTRTDKILDAIDDLLPDQYTEDGKPMVSALEEILGFHISAQERDEAFNLYEGGKQP